MSGDAQIESYLTTVSAQLGAATILEREKITEEIAAHVHTLVEKHGESVDTVLARLGPPEKLGERYRAVLTVCQASRSYLPTELLTASFRCGIAGILTALIGLAGYWLGGFFLVFGGLTLFWAEINLGPNKPILIGASFGNILAILGSGFLLLLLSTFLLRAMLRLLGRRQTLVVLQ